MIAFHKLTVKHTNNCAENAKLIDFIIPKPLKAEYQCQPGQHLTLKHTINGQEYRRPYSICQQINDGLQIAVRQLESGVFSSWVVKNLVAKMQIEVMTPQGEFKLNPSAPHQVFFAAGCGITPIIALIKQALEQQSQVHLFYGNRTLAHSMLIEELEALKNKFMGYLNLHYLFSQEQQTVDWLNGRLDVAKINDLIKLGLIPTYEANYYICGPSAMINSIKTTLLVAKIASDNIHFENFGTDLPISKVANSKITNKATNAKNSRRLQLKLRGKTTSIITNDATNILSAGLKAKLDLPYACQAGVCGTCKCKLIRGKVNMQDNLALENYDLTQGFILACQSTAETDEISIDFDN